MLPYQILACNMHGKILINHVKIVNLNGQLRHGLKSLNCLMDHIL